MKKKHLIKLIFILVIFFTFNLKPKAYSCYYKSKNTGIIEKIRIERADDPTLQDHIYIYKNSNTNSEPFYKSPFYPVNVIFTYSPKFLFWELKKSFQTGYILYTKGADDYNGTQTCPESIKIHYLKENTGHIVKVNDKEHEEFKIYTNEPGEHYSTFIKYNGYSTDEITSLLIEYSETGYEYGTTNIISATYPMGDSGTNVLSDISKSSNEFKTITFEYDAEKQPEETPVDEDGYISCEYRNENADKVNFKLRKIYDGSSEYAYIVNKNNFEIKVSRRNIDSFNNLTECPRTIAYPKEGNGNWGEEFWLLDDCSSSDFANDKGSCYVRTDLPFEYSDGVSKKIKYVSLKSSQRSIEIDILNAPMESGQQVIAKINEQEIIVNNLISSDFVSNNYPDYITKKGDSYSVNATITKDTKYDEVYIIYTKLNDLSGIKTSDIIFNCEQLFGDSFMKFLRQNVYIPFVIAIPIILIVLTTIDFAKVIFSENKDGLKKAGSKFAKRAIMTVIILLVPTILIFVADLIGVDEVQQCAKAIKNYSESS